MHAFALLLFGIEDLYCTYVSTQSICREFVHTHCKCGITAGPPRSSEGENIRGTLCSDGQALPEPVIHIQTKAERDLSAPNEQRKRTRRLKYCAIFLFFDNASRQLLLHRYNHNKESFHCCLHAWYKSIQKTMPSTNLYKNKKL